MSSFGKDKGSHFVSFRNFRILCTFSLVIFLFILSLLNYLLSLRLTSKEVKNIISPSPVYLLTDGRLGNIMFQYAAMAGICATRNLTQDITSCGIV
jgi:hypothetical protein